MRTFSVYTLLAALSFLACSCGEEEENPSPAAQQDPSKHKLVVSIGDTLTYFSDSVVVEDMETTDTSTGLKIRKILVKFYNDTLSAGPSGFAMEVNRSASNGTTLSEHITYQSTNAFNFWAFIGTNSASFGTKDITYRSLSLNKATSVYKASFSAKLTSNAFGSDIIQVDGEFDTSINP